MTDKAKIRQIMEETLDTKDFSDDDDFFELGGDSLGMVSILHRLEGDLGIVISPIDFFDGPSISQLAVLAARAQA